MSANWDDKLKNQLLIANQGELFDTLMETFDLDELRTLCLHLEIDFESLKGENKPAKVRELILYCIRTNSAGKLFDYCDNDASRAHIEWSKFFYLDSKETPEISSIQEDANNPTPLFHILIYTPEDVSDEHGIVLTVVDRLRYDRTIAEHVQLKTNSGNLPAQTGNPYNLIVCIFWKDIGPMGKSASSPAANDDIPSIVNDFKRIESPLLIYRRTQKVLLDPDSSSFAEMLSQHQQAKQFFDQMAQEDVFSEAFFEYDLPSTFEKLFEKNLRSQIKLFIQDALTPASNSEPDLQENHTQIWPGSPFPGLRAYKSEDAPIYFGRGRETDALVEHLSRQTSRFLAVVGASGSGKSSLVAAGLIPRLRQNAISNSAHWQVVSFTPDELGAGDPYASLAAALMRDPLQVNERHLAASLKADPSALATICQTAVSRQSDTSQILFFIDQFEELFTRIPLETRQTFIAMIYETVQTAGFRIIITLRADFYGRCLEHEQLADLLEISTYPLSAPGLIALGEMITRPAAMAGLTYEEGLPDRILADTGSDPGALALMAYALHQLYNKSSRQNHQLTWAQYKEFGGVQGAIGEQANETFERLTSSEQETLPFVFRELVEVDQRGVATRRRIPYSVICPSNDSPEARLVEALTEARLLVQTKGQKNNPFVEVAHEALFVSWPLLAYWINETSDDLRLLSQVRAAVKEWQANQFDKAYRWPDHRLLQVHQMVDRLQPEMDAHMQAFTRTQSQRYLLELEDSNLPHVRRAYIGRRLDSLDDDRPGVSTNEAGLPDIVWLPIQGEAIRLDENEPPQKIPSFYMSKYLVTYHQYLAFLNAEDGYNNPEWWNGENPGEPGEQLFKFGNHPADNVSWYDAVAFCRWLTFHFSHDAVALLPQREEGFNFPDEWQIRLPSEQEWQFAAMGTSTDTLYPWGKEWSPLKANTSESAVKQTTAVGMYPQGQSPFSVMDMCGNVWEWCHNLYDSGFGPSRVIRGGSWCGNHKFAQTTIRGWDLPVGRNAFRGFRVVLAVPLANDEVVPQTDAVSGEADLIDHLDMITAYD